MKVLFFFNSLFFIINIDQYTENIDLIIISAFFESESTTKLIYLFLDHKNNPKFEFIKMEINKFRIYSFKKIKPQIYSTFNENVLNNYFLFKYKNSL